MIKQIFVNLPVVDLERTKEFWMKLGFKFDPRFTDDKAAGMEMGENIYAMLLTKPFFMSFTKKEVADPATTEAINALSVESREKVDEMINKALAAGGKEPREAQDHGWMYDRCFEDLDGHLWEVLYMDISKFPANPS